MKALALGTLFALAALSAAGPPVERFRAADRFTFSSGDDSPQYGNVDANVRVVMQVTFLGQQVFDSTSGQPETATTKTAGSLDFRIRLSDFDPLFPPDTVTMVGADLGNDRVRHACDDVLPGPYPIEGTFNGVYVNIVLRNVRVTGSLTGLYRTVPLTLNGVLSDWVDTQFDDENAGAGNSFAIVPGQVSGYIISPIFTVTSLRADLTDMQQAGQVPLPAPVVVRPDSATVVLGRTDSGDVTSLRQEDGVSLRVCRFIVPNQSVAPIQVRVDGTTAVPPLMLDFTVRSRMATVGSFSQTLELFDWTSNAYDPADARTDLIDTNFASRTQSATGSASRYSASGALRAKYSVRQSGPAASLVWCHEADLAVWSVRG
jgi:hypothetical protein